MGDPAAQRESLMQQHNEDRRACEKMRERGAAAFHAGEPLDHARRNPHALDEACWRDGWLQARSEAALSPGKKGVTHEEPGKAP